MESIECRSSTAQSAPISRKLRRSTAQRLKQETAYVSVYEISDEASQAKPIPLALFQIFYYIQCIKNLRNKEKAMCETPIITEKRNASRTQIDLFATNLAIGFDQYPLSQHLFRRKGTVESMKTLWKVLLKTLPDKTLLISESAEARSVAVFQPWESQELTMWDYAKAGGIQLLFQFGPKTVMDMVAFDNFTIKIQNKYATPNSYYLYGFATLPQHRGKKYGSKIMNYITNYLDEHQKDCYLETHTPQNVAMYEHYGFKLKEATQYQNTPLTLYAMLRNPKARKS